MTLDAALSDGRSVGGVLLHAERGPTCAAGVAAEALATLTAGAHDDAAPVTAPQTLPAAPPQPRAHRAVALSGGARRPARSRSSRRLKQQAARCWPAMATVDEEEALELHCGPGADVGPEQQPAGSPLDGCGLRVSGECARCSSRRRRHSARLSRRAGAMGDQEIQPAGDSSSSDRVRGCVLIRKAGGAFCQRRRALASRAPVVTASPRAPTRRSRRLRRRARLSAAN
jgi:hypothetical protein